MWSGESIVTKLLWPSTGQYRPRLCRLEIIELDHTVAARDGNSMSACTHVVDYKKDITLHVYCACVS